MKSSGLALIFTLLNEAERLENLLASIGRQTLRPDEVVICDAGSRDKSLDIIQRWQSSASFPVKVIEAPGVNISEGRNIAISASEASIICVTDGGCVLDERWLENISRPLREDDELGVVYGRSEAVGESVVGRQYALFYRTKTGKERKTETELSSRSVAFRRSLWQQAGGYPEWMTLAGEDTYFFLELSKITRSRFAEDACVYWHHGAESLLKIYKMHERNSIGSGEANLWPLRYASLIAGYAFIVVGLAVSIWVHWLALAVFVFLIAVCSRQLIALVRFRTRSLTSFLLVPVITLVRDLGMSIGYLIGFRKRATKRISFFAR